MPAVRAGAAAAHKASVPGMRWLGTSPRIASFSSEKTQTGYKNTLLITGAVFVYLHFLFNYFLIIWERVRVG